MDINKIKKKQRTQVECILTSVRIPKTAHKFLQENKICLKLLVMEALKEVGYKE